MRIFVRAHVFLAPATEKVAHDRKVFFLNLKENQRGRFLKITEDVSGRRKTIMLPAPALADFAEEMPREIGGNLRLARGEGTG